MNLGLGLGLGRGCGNAAPKLQYANHGMPASIVGGGQTVADYLGNLVTVPAGIPAVEGGIFLDNILASSTSVTTFTYGGASYSGGVIALPASDAAWRITNFTNIAIAAGETVEVQIKLQGAGSTRLYMLRSGTGTYEVKYVRLELGENNSRVFSLRKTFAYAQTGFYVEVYRGADTTAESIVFGGACVRKVGASDAIKPFADTPNWTIVDEPVLKSDGHVVKAPHTSAVCIGDSFTNAKKYQRTWDLTDDYVATYDKGIGGDTLVQMDARFDTDVVSTSPSLCVIQGGVNDLANATESKLATMQSAVISMVNKANTAGITPILINVGPWSGSATWTEARQGYTDEYNAWLNAYCAGSALVIVDIYSALGGGSTSLAAQYDSGDGLHPNATGYSVIGNLLNVAASSLVSANKSASTQIYPTKALRTRNGSVVMPIDADPTEYPRYLGEGAGTNLFVAPGAPATQDIATTAQAYTVSVIGTGSVTLSGTASGVATEGSPLTVTATAGTLTCTVAGTLTHVQVEVGSLASSPIGYGVAVAGTNARLATVNSFVSAGRIRSQNCAMLGTVIPKAGGQPDSMLVSTYTSTPTRFLSVQIKNVSVRLRKYNDAPLGGEPTVDYTSEANVPLQHLTYWTTIGMGIAVRSWTGSEWGAWSTFATDNNADPAPIATTTEIGSRTGVNHFYANYPSLKTAYIPTLSSHAAVQAWLMRNSVWQEVIS